MKFRSLIFFSVFLMLSCSSSKQLKRKILHFGRMPYVPEMSGDKKYWQLVKKGLDVVPSLIRLIDDTTVTSMNIPNFAFNYRIGDVALYTLNEIIRVDITKVDSGFAVDYRTQKRPLLFFLRDSYKNRVVLRESYERWCHLHVNDLYWVTDTIKYHTAVDWKFSTPCHPAGGYFRCCP